jgi:undecaprenyl-diphosphatase
MLNTLLQADEKAFLFLNGLHTPFLDPLMWLFSDKLFWIPLYAWFLWLLYRKFPAKYWTVLLAVALMILVSDQLCNLFKDNIGRLRPANDPHLQSLVYTINGYTGASPGFYSAHSSNAFALAMFVIITLREKRRFILPVALIYAILTAYSRIYLGVHYPGDVLAGALAGSLIGFLFSVLHFRLRAKLDPARNQ